MTRYRPTHGHPNHYPDSPAAMQARDEARARIVLRATADSPASVALAELLRLGEERAA